MSWWVRTTMSRIGGATIPVPERIVPPEPGKLILMNHQSLFDIPLVVRTVGHGYPRIVTRNRYGRSIPLISHMVRLYQYPTVEPSANKKELSRMLDDLERAGRESDVPIALFPEGTRTRDGEIGRWRRAGLRRLLAARDWTVYIFVADGFWKAGKYSEIAAETPRIDGEFAHVGTLEWTDPTADPEPFIQEARQMMIDGLNAMRGVSAPA